MNRPKHRKNKRLLELLGCDPHEEQPTFEEARDSVPREKPPERIICPFSGKHSFPSQSTARQAATNRMKKGSGTGAVRQYLCPDCSMWHLSSSFHR